MWVVGDPAPPRGERAGLTQRQPRTRQTSARHPRTGEWIWFNQAHLLQISNLEPEIRSALEDSLEPEALPRNACHGDGTPIGDGAWGKPKTDQSPSVQPD